MMGTRPDRFCRVAWLCLTLLALAACSTSDNEPNPNPPPLVLELSGPLKATPGETTAGFEAVLKRGDQPLNDVFVKLEPTLGTMAAPTGFPGTNGARTDSAGRIQFALELPLDVDEPTTVTITASVDDDDVGDAESTHAVAVDPIEIKVTLTGPLEASTGTSTPGFVATATKDGEPLSDVAVSLVPTVGTVDAPTGFPSTNGASTDSEGKINFSLRLPQSVGDATTVRIDAAIDIPEGTANASRTVAIKQAPLTLVLSGPQLAPPGLVTPGFTATLSQGGRAIENAFVSLVPSAGMIDAPAGFPNTNGANTDSFGKIPFALRLPGSISEPTTVTITATASIPEGQTSTTYLVAVQPDVFQFISPASQSSTPIGIANAVRLRFQWTRESAEGPKGVAGRVELTASDDGIFVVQGVTQPANTPVVMNTDGVTGDFTAPVSSSATRTGPVTITAKDLDLPARTTELRLQFTEVPASISLDATPIQVQTAPSQQRFSSLSAIVRSAGNQPIQNVEVDFVLVTPVSTSINERVAPSGGVTNANGTVTSQYEAGPTAGAALVRACVRNTAICSQREVTVVMPPPGTPSAF